MSWFKKQSESKNSQPSSETSSLNSEGMVERRSRHDTDPAICLEVFRNHWEQAYQIISRDMNNGHKSTTDEIEAVSQNFEQMVTLLAEEEGEEGQGMPGPILHYLLEHEIIEKFCGWCHRNEDDTGNLIKEQLRMFEHLISQANQLLLIHKPIIRPLLNLLAYCGDDLRSKQIEPQMVLVLHQVCISISKEATILESFFNMSADHGSTKFLIFSLLIPFIHRERSVGQQARDALLLIMALSSKHPYIGAYIAENSNFCPVLATGLSGLYSDLPRKIEIPSEDWFHITDENVQNMPELAMFLNSLVFCNAVVQIAHPLVRDQLIKFIYNGFLVPVLGPALHQDIMGLPTPLLDSPMFANSREEVITATAYLDLFLRKISEPALMKAFLVFIFTEKNDEIVILDSLITRINSSSKLCLVSLSLFRTLVDLNCEDVMFDLVFKHLIPCTHVMVSQRRSVRDQDLYSKSAEKFLSLRPTCCLPEIDSPKHNMGDLPGLPKLTNKSNSPSLPKFLRSRSERGNRRLNSRKSEPKVEAQTTAFPPGTYGSKLEHFETSYVEYLHDANICLQKCARACCVWLYPYDGETPPPTSLATESSVESSSFMESAVAAAGKDAETADATSSLDFANEDSVQREVTVNEVENSDKGGNSMKQSGSISDDRKCDTRTDLDTFIPVGSAIDTNDVLTNDTSKKPAEEACSRVNYATEADFISMLEESESPRDMTVNVEESLKSLDSLLSTSSVNSISRTSTPRKNFSQEGALDRSQGFTELGDYSELSTVYYDCETSITDCDNDKFKSINETSFEVIDDLTRNKTSNATEFEILDSQLTCLNNNETPNKTQPGNDLTSFIEISVSETKNISSVSKNSSNLKEDNLVDKEKDNSETTEIGAGDSLSKTDNNKKTSAQAQSGILASNEVGKGDNESKSERGGSVKGDRTVRFATATTLLQPRDTLPRPPSFGVGLASYKQSSSPSIGPFLMAILMKLEGMMHNSLPVNLMLTGLISRLASYSQPLLRSFLLNHNLVFQPTVKSLVQVLTSVRQKIDHYSYTVQNFEALLLRARRTLAQREGVLPERGISLSPSPEMVHTKLRSSTVAEIPSKEKRHRTLSQLLFRRTPNDKKPLAVSSATNAGKLEILGGNKGMRYINRKHEDKVDKKDNQVESIKTRNAVYCAIVLEEFVKELAALVQEHAILHLEDGMYCNS